MKEWIAVQVVCPPFGLDTFWSPRIGLRKVVGDGALFQWCLEHDLQVVQPMTLMTVGLYNEPAGAYLPSILY